MAYIFLETYPENTTPIKDPIPGPNRLNPTAPCEKWYTSENRVENVVNMSRKMPYILIRLGIIEHASLKTPRYSQGKVHTQREANKAPSEQNHGTTEI